MRKDKEKTFEMISYVQRQMNQSQKVQTIINIITGVLVLVFNMGISFFVSPYIVKTLGEEANGFTQLASNFVSYASLITLAFNSMASRFISICFHRDDIDGVNKYYSSTMICNLIITAIMLPFALYMIQRLDNIIVIESANINDVKVLFACVFANFFISLLSSVYSISMFVKNALYIQNTISFIRSFLNACLLIVLFYCFPPRIFFVSLVGVFLTIVFTLATILIHKRLMPDIQIKLRYFNAEAVKKMVASGIWNTINQCGSLLMTGLDLVVTNLLVSPVSMGVLAVAKTIPTAIINLASTLNANLAPSLTINWAKGNRNLLLKELRSGMKISSVIVSIPLMVFCAFGVEFYSLWMPTLDAKQLTLLSFLTCMAFVPWAGPQALNNIFTAANKLKVSTVTFCLSGLLNIIITFILLKTTDLGIYAVAGTSSVIQIIRCITVTAPYIAYLMELKWYTFYKDALISTLCCLLNYIISRCIAIVIYADRWDVLIIDVLLSVIASFSIDLFVVLNKEERCKLIARIIKK